MSAPQLTAVHTEGGLLPPDLLERVARTRRRAARTATRGLRTRARRAAQRRDQCGRGPASTACGSRSPSDSTGPPTPRPPTSRRPASSGSLPLLQELGFGRLESERPVVFDPIDNKTYPVSHRASGVAIHLLGARADLDKRTAGSPPSARHGAGVPQPQRRPPVGARHQRTALRLLRDIVVADPPGVLRVRPRGHVPRPGVLRLRAAAGWSATPHDSSRPTAATARRRRATWSDGRPRPAPTAPERSTSSVAASRPPSSCSAPASSPTPPTASCVADSRSGELSLDEYHRQLLRLVYRLIFLLVAEIARAAARPTAPSPRRSSATGVGTRSTRIVRAVAAAPRHHPRRPLEQPPRRVRRARRPRATRARADRTGLVPVVRRAQSRDLGPAGLPNRALLDAVHALTTVYESTGRRGRPVPERRLPQPRLRGARLGLRGLLELHPRHRRPHLRLGTAAGNERKTTGSYYTPTPLITSAARLRARPGARRGGDAADPEAAILALKVLDPAAGSGHFLIAAAHRIAHRLASVRSGEAEPSPDELRHALRDVIAHCVYGVDVNPMAVELCKVSLWMEAMEPGKPLSFLDHHIVCGNSLLGHHAPRCSNDGLPDDAFKVLDGDDKTWVSTLKKRNKAERKHRSRERSTSARARRATCRRWRRRSMSSTPCPRTRRGSCGEGSALCRADGIRRG